MDSRADNLTPEERWRIRRAMGINVGGFLSIIVHRLIAEPPLPTEPYIPDDSIPPSPYIPLALR
jgi:hypothetical protein